MKGTLTCTAAVFAAAFGIGVWAQAPAPRLLPLDNLGLEHLDIVVPDTAASAKFYARIFRTKLHQQPVRDALRYFVLLGDLPQDRQIGYIAIGAAQGRPASIGHYCVLAKTYNRDAFASALDAAGLPSKTTAPGPIGATRRRVDPSVRRVPTTGSSTGSIRRTPALRSGRTDRSQARPLGRREGCCQRRDPRGATDRAGPVRSPDTLPPPPRPDCGQMVGLADSSRAATARPIPPLGRPPAAAARAAPGRPPRR